MLNRNSRIQIIWFEMSQSTRRAPTVCLQSGWQTDLVSNLDFQRRLPENLLKNSQSKHTRPRRWCREHEQSGNFQRDLGINSEFLNILPKRALELELRTCDKVATFFPGKIFTSYLAIYSNFEIFKLKLWIFKVAQWRWVNVLNQNLKAHFLWLDVKLMDLH